MKRMCQWPHDEEQESSDGDDDEMNIEGAKVVAKVSGSKATKGTGGVHDGKKPKGTD